MKKKLNKIILLILILILIAGLGYYFLTTDNQPEEEKIMTDIIPSQNSDVTDNKEEIIPAWQNINAKDIIDAHSSYLFSAQIPANWQVEAVPETQAINIFDPRASGEDSLEKSQIFIRYFKANTFLTLGTVTIYSKTETKINNRPAVIYNIEKKPNVANFANQPLWRNHRHVVTDVRVSDNNPSIFYVFAQQPNLSQEVYNKFLDSLKVRN